MRAPQGTPSAARSGAMPYWTRTGSRSRPSPAGWWSCPARSALGSRTITQWPPPGPRLASPTSMIASVSSTRRSGVADGPPQRGQEITGLWASPGLACLFISHDLSVTRYVSDRIALSSQEHRADGWYRRPRSCPGRPFTSVEDLAGTRVCGPQTPGGGVPSVDPIPHHQPRRWLSRSPSVQPRVRGCAASADPRGSRQVTLVPGRPTAEPGVSSPCTRRYPQAGFSPASRNARVGTAGVLGPAVHPGVVMAWVVAIPALVSGDSPFSGSMPLLRGRVSGVAGTLGEGQADLDQHPSGSVPDTAAAPSAGLSRRGVPANRSAQFLLALADEFFRHVRVHEHGPHDLTCRRGCGRGRAPWLGRRPGRAGQAEGSHARGARAGSAAFGYGFFSLSVISSAGLVRAGLTRRRARLRDRFFGNGTSRSLDGAPRNKTWAARSESRYSRTSA